MRRFIQRAIASVLLAALVLTSAPGSVAVAEETSHVHVHEEDSPLYVSAEELAGGEVLLVTTEMLDEKGVVNVAGGNWDRIVVTREIGAKKVVFTGITAKTLVIESGSECSYEVSNSVITDVTVVAANLEVMDYETLVAMLASGISASEVADAYTAYQKEKKEVAEILPDIVVKGGSEITSLTVGGNAKLNLKAAKVAEVKVMSDGTQDRTEVVLEGYNGTVSIDQKDAGNGANSILNLDLKDSALAALNIAGTEKSVCYIEGIGESNVTTATITGATQVTMNVDATEVKLDENAKKASLHIYSDITTVTVQGDNNNVRMAASATIGTAVIEGDNVKVNNSGKINESTVSGAGSDIAYVPVYTATPKPTEIPKPTAAPEPTKAPEQPDTPTPPAEDVHVHTWNVPTATCNTAKQCTDPKCGFIEEAATGLHEFETEGVVTAATCVEGGYTTFTCKYCTEQKQDNFTGPKGHSVAEWTIGAKAENETCLYTQTGICTVCNETQTSETKVEKHNADLVVSIETAATCQTAGTKAYTCPDCEKVIRTESYTNSDAHSWDGGTAENGKTIYKCTVSGCGATKSVVTMTEEGVSSKDLDANTQVETGSGVVMSLDNSVLQQIGGGSTTTSSGSAIKLSADVLDTTQREAAVSNLKEEEKEQLGDNDIYDLNMLVNDGKVSSFSGEVTVRIPYVLQDGDDPDAVGVWYLGDNGQVEMIQGKFHDGFVSFATRHFSYYTVVRLSAEARCKLFGHLWLSATTNPTCTEDGYVTNICQRCGETTITPGEKATGHAIVETVIEEATCQHKGKHRRECNNKHCPYYTEVETPKAEHKLKEKKDGRHEATCTQDGYIEYECKDKDCKHYKNEVIPALGHEKGKDGRCKRCGMDMVCAHPMVLNFVELAEGAKTCKDGVVCTNRCLACDSVIGEVTVNNHTNGYLEVLNAYPYGDKCDAFVALRGCACGETEKNIIFSRVNAGVWEIFNYRETREDSIECYVTEYVCEADNVILKRSYHDEKIAGETCKVIRHTTWELFVNDESKGVISAPVIQNSHYYAAKAVLAEGSKTCTDGVIVKNVCLRCGSEGEEWTSDQHEMSVVKAFDLAELNEASCGGFIVHMECPCGEDGTLTYVGNGQCDLRWSDTRWIKNEDGVVYYTRTRRCDKCEFDIVEDYSLTPLDNCKAERKGTLSIFAAEETKYDYTFKQEYHHNQYCEAKLLEGSKSCEDGVLLKWFCNDCGKKLDEYETNYHEVAVKEVVDFSKYANTCGGRMTLDSCACGEKQWVSYPYDGHELVWNYKNVTDENGMEYEIEILTCRNCSIKSEQKSAVAKNEGCTAVVSHDYKIYANGALLDNWVFTALEENHDSYTSDAVLIQEGTTCENGVIVTEKCWKCDWEHTWENRGDWHPGILVNSIDLGALGITCGGYIRNYECPCGAESYINTDEFKCDTGTDFWDMIYNDYGPAVETVDGVEIYRKEYTCSVTEPACGVHFLMEKREHFNEETCTGDRVVYLNADADGDGTYEISVKVVEDTYNSHRQFGETVVTYEKAEDGTPLRVETISCTGCGQYKNVDVYADYLGDESYGYFIRSQWGTEEFWNYENFNYHFDNDCCTYTRTRSNSNGYYEELETRPGCMTDNVSSWATCTDYAYGVCLKCGEENALNPRMYGEPMGHNFCEKESGNGYECSRCGLESINGSSGMIVLEDASDDTNFIASYWNEEELVYEIFVFLVTADEDIMTDLKPVDVGAYQTGTATLSKASVEAWAAANGVTGSYDVMFGFIPKNASVDTSYYITFTEQHNWAYKTELLSGSTSCSDGILVTEYCLDCGEIGESWKSTEHKLVVETVLDLSAVSGSCGGQIVVEECACGEKAVINHGYSNCEFYWRGGNTTPMDGYDVVMESHYCSVCGVVFVKEYTRTPMEGCRAKYVGTLKLYAANDTENAVAITEFDIAMDYHEGRESLELLENAESCEDGVKVVSDCKDCGIRLNEYVTYGHYMVETATVDTSSVEGTCGEVFGLMECVCGQNKGWDFSRNWEHSTIPENTVDKDGVEHLLVTRTCVACSVWLLEDQAYVPMEDCKALVRSNFDVYVGSSLVGTFDYETIQDYHAVKEVFELHDSLNCENGVNVTAICEDCGIQLGQDSYTGHRVYPVAEMDASKIEGTCGEVFRIVECVCGQERSISFPDNWSWTETFENVVDDTGVEHNLQTRTCNTCSVRLEQDRTATKGENCTGTAIYEFELYVGDTLVGEYTQERVEAMHATYVVEGSLNEGSVTCTDGATYIRKCRDCDYTETYLNCGHENVPVATIDLSENGACGGIISLYGCPCTTYGNSEVAGFTCDTGYSWQDMKHNGYNIMEDNGDSFVGQVEHTCKNCGFVFKFKRIEYPTDENSGTGTVYFCVNGTEYIVENFSYTKN